MGLENLKSLFSEITIPEQSDVTKMTSKKSNIGVVDFFDSPILGFTMNFNALDKSQLAPGGAQTMITPTATSTNSWNIDGNITGPVNFQNNPNQGFSLSPSQIPAGFTKHFTSKFESKFVPNNIDMLQTNYGTGDQSITELLDMRIKYSSTTLGGAVSTLLGLFASGDIEGSSPIALYNIVNYDSRTPHNAAATVYGGDILNKNSYQGTKFDGPIAGSEEFGGIGGKFNSTNDDNKYSVIFRTIQKPKGFGDATLNGQNYFTVPVIRKESRPSIAFKTFVDSRDDAQLKYIEGGEINLENSSWWVGGDKATAPNLSELYDPLLTGLESTAGLNTRTVRIGASDLIANTLKDTDGWEALYKADHTNKDDVGYHYTGVSRDNLNIRHSSGDSGHSFSRTSADILSTMPESAMLSEALHGFGGREPYIISKIPKGEDRELQGSRSIPAMRSATDVTRLTKFLSSPAGIAFFAKQNALGFISNTVYRERSRDSEGKEIIKSTSQLLKSPGTKSYLQSSTLAAAARLVGTDPNVLVKRGLPFPGIKDRYEDWLKRSKKDDSLKETNIFNDGNVNDSFMKPLSADNTNFWTDFGTAAVNYGRRALGLPADLTPPEQGDFFTNMPVDASTETGESESEKNGMPFYITDLRTAEIIYFRAYIDSLNENVTPSWEPESYIGRSEPAYIYKDAERNITFNLSLFALTSSELENIYNKLNRLTSLCYPGYATDVHYDVGMISNPNETRPTGTNKSKTKLRKIPPLASIRLGELYGNSGEQINGFFQSFTYTFPDNGVWETSAGKRVPKYITVAFDFKVIHATVPSAVTGRPGGETFFGYGAK